MDFHHTVVLFSNSVYYAFELGAKKATYKVVCNKYVGTLMPAIHVNHGIKVDTSGTLVNYTEMQLWNGVMLSGPNIARIGSKDRKQALLHANMSRIILCRKSSRKSY